MVEEKCARLSAQLAEARNLLVEFAVDYGYLNDHGVGAEIDPIVELLGGYDANAAQPPTKAEIESARLSAVIEEALTYLRGQGGEHFVAFDAAAAFNGVLAILAKATPKNESRGLNVDGGYTCPKCGEGPNLGLGEGGDLYHRCFAVPVGIEGEKTDQTLQEVLGVTLEEASRNAREMELELRARYFLKTEWADYVEVTKEQFVNAERSADFYNTMGQPNEPATGGFSGHGVSGKVEYSAPTTRDDADE
jgi:hypothetical protein